jgi:hypothetical protein
MYIYTAISINDNVLCNYGCNQLAKYKNKRGTFICESHHNKCPALIKIKEDKKKIVGKDGLTINQRKIIKTNTTKQNNVNAEGLNIHQQIGIKSRDTMLNIKDKFGRNLYELNGLKSVQTLKSQYDLETGLSRFDLIHLKSKTAIVNKFDTLNHQTEIFLENKYSDWYYNIIDNAKNQYRKKRAGIYFEKHHIIPRSLDGNNNKNLILLTAKEHYICHLLLTKMTIGNARIKMLHAFDNLSSRLKIKSKAYAKIKQELSVIRSEKLKGNGICYISKENRQKNITSRDNSYLKNNVWICSINQNIQYLIHKDLLNEYIINGYTRGMLPTVWMYNIDFKISKRVLKTEIIYFLDKGFILGRR